MVNARFYVACEFVIPFSCLIENPFGSDENQPAASPALKYSDMHKSERRRAASNRPTLKYTHRPSKQPALKYSLPNPMKGPREAEESKNSSVLLTEITRFSLVKGERKVL